MRFSLPALLSAALGAVSPAFAEPGAEIVTGVEYQEGDFFTGEQVEILSVQNVLRVRTGQASFSVSLPWHRIEAPGNVVGGGGLLGLPIIVDQTQPATRTSRQGIGDLRLGAGYTIPSLAGFEFSLNGQVKLPTASASRGIGTGETDFSVGAEAARSFGSVTPFVAIGYTMPGDPAAYDLRNSLSARGGIALQIANGVRGNVSYGFAESASSLVPDESQISTGLSAAISSRVNLGIFGSAGLSQGSADLGAGLSLGLRL